jgi:hypothetical protein
MYQGLIPGKKRALSTMDVNIETEEFVNNTLVVGAAFPVAVPGMDEGPKAAAEKQPNQQLAESLSQRMQDQASENRDEQGFFAVPLDSKNPSHYKESPPAAETSDDQRVPAGGKEKTSRPSLVSGLSEWNFPAGVMDKSRFVGESLRKGSDAKVISRESSKTPSPTHPSTPPRQARPARVKRVRYDEKSLEENVIGAEDLNDRPVFGSPRSRRRITEDPVFEKKIHPKATGIEFDTRFLGFAVAADGSKMEEKLVWTTSDQSNEEISHDIRKACVEMIPDLPKRLKKSLSRVGPMYQARIPRKGDCVCNTTDWDEPPG